MHKLPGTRRWRALWAGMLMVVALVPAPSAGAAADPWASDPLRLVPFADTVQRPYTNSPDVWEVWICQVPGWSIALDPAATAADLDAIVSPYFSWLSGGAYTPDFVAGGTVSSNDQVTTDPNQIESLFAPECETKVSQAASGTTNGALIVVAAGFAEGYGTAGAVCPEPPFSGCQTTYPQNARLAVVGAGTITTVPPLTEPRWATVAHEIGHAINWAHSYGGLTTLGDSGVINKYDNPMDIMSRSALSGVPVGTIAYNRYASGWIQPSQVAVHNLGRATYDLAGIDQPGTQMLVIPTGIDGLFYTLGTRRRVSYDTAVPVAGVEVYQIDQRRSACAVPSRWPSHWPCFATFTRISPVPAVADEAGVEHVLTLGESVTVAGFTVQVVASDLSKVRVEVFNQASGRFVDDDGNPHEPDIETIAALGITRGCNPPANDRYCPAGPVTRGEMAAFLIRALGEEANLGAHQGYFPDVAAGDWYAPYVERLFDLGVATGYVDGTYRPLTLVPRSEMAAFLVRAFGFTAVTPVGVFADVPADAWYTDEVETLYGLGVTNGCSTNPLSYCPHDPVKRDQMASFLARALDR